MLLPSSLKPGKNTLIVEFRGKLSDNNFTSAKDPKIPKVSGTPDKIKIEIESSKEVEVPLPGTDKEQGVFELRLKVTTKKPKQETYTAESPVFVRAFDHFAGVKKPVIAFVTGASTDAFFKHAQKFWRRNADAILIRPDMSIKEILDVLEVEGEKFGPWGQVNIVAHGNRHLVLLKIFPDSPKVIDESIIDEELKRTEQAADQGVDGFEIPKPKFN